MLVADSFLEYMASPAIGFYPILLPAMSFFLEKEP